MLVGPEANNTIKSMKYVSGMKVAVFSLEEQVARIGGIKMFQACLS